MWTGFNCLGLDLILRGPPFLECKGPLGVEGAWPNTPGSGELPPSGGVLIVELDLSFMGVCDILHFCVCLEMFINFKKKRKAS